MPKVLLTTKFGD